MKKIFERIGKIISSAIFVILMMLIVIILVYIVRIKFLASNSRLGEVRTNFYTILTQSMYPTIKAGDIVVTYKDKDNNYNTGDIITFTTNGSSITVTHRITEIYEVNGKRTYRTKGDNNNTADMTTIPAENVIGRVVFRIPKAGYIQQFMVTKTGWIVVVVIPCLGIVIYDILKMFKVAAKKKKQKKLVETDDVINIKKKLNEVIEEDETEN